MHAIALLREQHKRIEALLRRAIEADGDAKQALFDELAERLWLHTELEERGFYPAVRARRTEEVLLDSLEDHSIMKCVIEQLFELSASDPAFDARLRVLFDVIEHHFEEEEDELFATLMRVLGREALEALGRELSALAADLVVERDAAHAAAAFAGRERRSAGVRDARLQR